MSNSVINALKRLERAGSEDSKATQKLCEAAAEVAEVIIKNVPVGVPLPRSYEVVKRHSNISYELFLINSDGEYIDGIGRYLHGDLQCWIPEQKRNVVLNFAQDIATGLLDEIADFIEQEAMKSNKATETLENSIKEGEARE